MRRLATIPLAILLFAGPDPASAQRASAPAARPAKAPAQSKVTPRERAASRARPHRCVIRCGTARPAAGDAPGERLGRRYIVLERDRDRGAVARRSDPGRRSGPRWQDVEAKNRGELATLDGIYRGKRYTLVNPTTGRVDRNARVIWLSVNRWNKVPFARIRFSNGHKATYAAERLQLVGKPLGFQKAYLRRERQKIVDAIEKELGVPATGVRVVGLEGRNQVPRRRNLRNGQPARPYMGPFLTALGEGLEPGEALLGYQFDDRAYVSRQKAAFDIATVTHEVLHGLSRNFVDQMFDAKMVNVLEGITDYFTFRVVTPRFGVLEKPTDAYSRYTRFAEQLANKVGEERLKAIFFSKDPNLVRRLAHEVDRAVGEKGAFRRAARRLERDLDASLD